MVEHGVQGKELESDLNNREVSHTLPADPLQSLCLCGRKQLLSSCVPERFNSMSDIQNSVFGTDSCRTGVIRAPNIGKVRL
jgi:hypothetical protein